MTFESGMSKNDNYTSIHRLNMCLYTDIKGLEVHHNNKRKGCNWIWNLTPIEKELHDELDQLQEPDFSKITQQLHQEFKENHFKEKRNNLSNRDEFIFGILIELFNKKKPNEIVKKFKNKIGLTKIYEIKNYYFYLEEFFKYLYLETTKGVSLFNENFNYQWENILNFEPSYEYYNPNTEAFYEHIKLYFENEYKNSLLIRDDAYY